eukprot:snap_masked-scaffold_16-processed-gene-4.14-mRNA-1 protein AED:1.00 eAED:1.00 QI:0/0/0/0/1/1/3/0/184
MNGIISCLESVKELGILLLFLPAETKMRQKLFEICDEHLPSADEILCVIIPSSLTAIQSKVQTFFLGSKTRVHEKLAIFFYFTAFCAVFTDHNLKNLHLTCLSARYLISEKGVLKQEIFQGLQRREEISFMYWRDLEMVTTAESQKICVGLKNRLNYQMFAFLFSTNLDEVRQIVVEQLKRAEE